MFKFIHAADLHLDSALLGLERYEGAPVDEIRGATRRAVEALIDLAIEEQVAFVVIAGDVYDGNWRHYNTGLHFVLQMQRLRDVKIPVYAIAGNHDAANRMTRSLTLPDNVIYLAHQKPQTVMLEELGVAIHGQGFATAAVREDLSQAFPHASQGMINIGLLHTCATGRPGHEPYAPCTTEGLRTKDYDYWALGHVHTREELCRNPLIEFPGNLQGRHARECGSKGCLMVTVDDDQSMQADFRSLDVVRWQRLKVDISDAPGFDDVLGKVSTELMAAQKLVDDLTLAVRVELVGRSPVHRSLLAQRQRLTNEIRLNATDVGRGRIWIEKLELHSLDGSPKRDTSDLDGPLGTLAALVAQLRQDPERLRQLVDLSDLAAKLPAELNENSESPPLDDPEWLSAVLAEAEPLLASRLLGKDRKP